MLQGAIFLDSDLEAVRRCYLAHFPLPDDPLVLLQVRRLCAIAIKGAVLLPSEGREVQHH